MSGESGPPAQDAADYFDGYVLDGQTNLTVVAIQGDIMTDVFLLGLDTNGGGMIDQYIDTSFAALNGNTENTTCNAT